MPANELTVLPPASLAVMGVTINGPVMHFPDDMSEDDWLALHRPFQGAEMGIGWWRGDWYNYGEARFMHFAQVLEVPDKKKRTFQNNGSVCSQYTPEERERTWLKLSFTHHAVVAYLDKPLRERLLSVAIDNDWSVADLVKARDELRKRGEEAEAQADMGAGAPVNEEFIPVALPLTVKSIAALVQDHLEDGDDQVALRAWLTDLIGDGWDGPAPAPPADEEEALPWNVHAATLIREAIEEAEAYAELPGSYKQATVRLANWIESQGEQEGENG